MVAISLSMEARAAQDIPKEKVKIAVNKKHSVPQTEYAAQVLEKKLGELPKGWKINISISDDKTLAAEGFSIKRKGKTIHIIGNDASGAIYGANRLANYYLQYGNIDLQEPIQEAPEMLMRGACVGLQKTVYLPGLVCFRSFLLSLSKTMYCKDTPYFFIMCKNPKKSFGLFPKKR